MDPEPQIFRAPEAPADGFTPELALNAAGLLADFNRGGVLSAADVHVAASLGGLAAVEDQQVLLALALAVRAPRLGHVLTDLATVAQTVVVDEPGEPLPWPDPVGWVLRVAGCEQLVAVEETVAGEGLVPGEEAVAGEGPVAGEEPVPAERPVPAAGAARRPLRLSGTRLYLDRYWQEERELAATLAALSRAPLPTVELDRLAGGVARLFPDGGDALQRTAATSAALRGLTVIAGGPGTGKTTTVARASALIFEEASWRSSAPPLLALCAPTGRAATRLQQAIQEQAAALDVSPEVRAQLLALRGSTIHRLLGWRGGSGPSGYRHGPENRLPHDVVIVDETSMVSLSLMARLLGAVRSDARVVLVGDPDQLAAVEAGAVLRDIVGPAAEGVRFSAGMRAIVARVTGEQQPEAAAERWFGDGVVTLRRGHRFGAHIGAFADSIRRGDADAALAALGDEITWIKPGSDGLELLRGLTTATYGEVVRAAQAGDGRGALAALSDLRILCAHRRGPYGVSHWGAQTERWLREALPGFPSGPGRYVGEPLLITENDHELRLHNGDAGVVISGGEREGASAVFEREGELLALAPSRLQAVEPLYAMTIHKSQGSQFDVTAVVLPQPDSRILTRELLYTAVTRARRRLIVIGTEESLRAAISRPVARASGLQERLWG